MGNGVVWYCLAVGLVGWLICVPAVLFAGAGAGTPKGVSGFAGLPLLWALVLPWLGWALTLPATPPFSAGQGLGRGFLMGGLAALAGAALTGMALAGGTPNAGNAPTARSAFADSTAAAATWAGPLCIALVPVCIAQLFLRSSIIDALLGIALGHTLTTLLLHSALLAGGAVLSSTGESNNVRRAALQMVVVTLFATALSAAVGLGVYRDLVYAGTVRGTYPTVAIALAAATALGSLTVGPVATLLEHVPAPCCAVAAPRSPTVVEMAPAAVLGLALPVGFGYLIAFKILNDLTPLYCIGVGALLGYLLWWVCQESAAGPSQPLPGPPPSAMLLVLGGFIFAYQLMQGYGVGLMVLTAFCALAPLALCDAVPLNADGSAAAEPTRGTLRALTLLMAFVTALLLSRLAAMRLHDFVSGAVLTDQYALVGLLAGAVAPALVAGVAWPADSALPAGASSTEAFPSRQGPTDKPSGQLLPPLPLSVRLPLALLLSAVVPAVLVALWGAKMVGPWFAGSALAMLGLWSLSRPRVRAQTAAQGTCLFAMAMLLLVTIFTPQLVPLATASRSQRLHAVLTILAIVVVAAIVGELAAAARAAMLRRRLRRGAAAAVEGS